MILTARLTFSAAHRLHNPERDAEWNLRMYGKDNNPATAVRQFLKGNGRFQVDEEIDARLLMSVAPGGYLRCVKDAT